MNKKNFNEIKDYYDNLYNEKKEDSFSFNYVRTKTFLQPLFEKRTSAHKVLDIGCGVGYACKMLHDHGYSVYGIDISSKALEFAKRKLPNCQFKLANPLGKIDFENQYFDALTCFGVLEHIENTQAFVQECYRVHKTDSTAVFVVPNSSSPYFRISKNGTGQILEVPRTLKEWNRIFKAAGFEIKSIKRDPGPSFLSGNDLIMNLRFLLNKMLNLLPISFTYQFIFDLYKVKA